MKKNPSLYPFTAIVGQESMKRALILNLITPSLSGVLIRGEKGTAKSTAVRALAEILPSIEVICDCPFQLSPAEGTDTCEECYHETCREKRMAGKKIDAMERPIRVVELPVGATEDRVVGTMDLEHALQKGEKRIEPGLLAAVHRGMLYVDEVNLLDDHVVDVLLDSAAMGRNTLEREGISFTHPAKFVLIGTMNPEEGELRPQLLDRFGLCVRVEGIREFDDRVRVMEQRVAFEENPEGFMKEYTSASKELVAKIEAAQKIYPQVTIARELLFDIATYCVSVGVDGHRGDIIMMKTAKTLAAYEGRTKVVKEDIDKAAQLVLPHRMRRQPLMEMADKIERI